MNFDDEEDSDFNFSSQSNNKLASLFKSNNEPSSNSDNLKYKPTKQPQTAPASSSTTQQQQTSSSVLFFSSVLAFKYSNNRYEPQGGGGKLGLAIINSQNQYRILIYQTKTQPLANIKLTLDFKLAIQKNNYTSFYDESSQLWSILFDNEELVASFGTNIVLCKCNLIQGNLNDSYKLCQDLKASDTAELNVEAGDSVEISSLITVWKDMKLGEVVENSQQKPIKLRLGKNKLPQYIEDCILEMKQGDRRLYVVKGAHLQSHYSNLVNLIVFYDINILRIKKNINKDRSNSNATNDSVQLPKISNLNQNQYDSEQESRSRSESVRDKTKTLNEQLLDPKSEKAKLISRMAKMGQQTLPGLSTANSNLMNETEDNEDWENSNLLTSKATKLNSYLQDTNNVLSLNAANILLQQQKQAQQIQQQIALPNQLYQSASASQILPQQSNQLALYSNPQLLMYPQAATPQTPLVETKPNTLDTESTSKILTKLELITEKIDQVKTITQINNQNMPNMETSILLQNIQRIVRENEQYKKDLYEKSNKIEEQNGKITELLMKAQNYVEQSHLILEQKNSSFQSNAEKNGQRILELEQDKMKLTSDLSTLTAKISELNLEINKMQKADLEMKQQLIDVSKNTDTYKQNAERLLVENADLQTKFDTIVAEMKKERQLRKSIETKLQLNEDELVELRAGSSNSQKVIEERKRKLEEEKQTHEKEMEDLKKTHQNEINLLKEKISKLKLDTSESQSEQIKQIEAELNNEWQLKLEKSIQQLEQKYQRQFDEQNAEKENLSRQFEESKEQLKQMKLSFSQTEADKDKFKHELDDLNVFKEKYERLQSQALTMKERYETRIRELLDAEPDSEVIGEEVKKTMNAIYRKLKSQIKPEQFYGGNGILTGMLKIIKMVTLQILHNDQEDSNNQEDQDIDYFSEHIYQTSLPVQSQEINQFKPAKINEDQKNSANITEDIIQEKKEEKSIENSSKAENELEAKSEVEEDDNGIELINDEEPESKGKKNNNDANTVHNNSDADEKSSLNNQDIDLNEDGHNNVKQNNELDSNNLKEALLEKSGEEEKTNKIDQDISNSNNSSGPKIEVPDDNDDDHEGEFDVYDKQTSSTLLTKSNDVADAFNSSSNRTKSNNLFDDDDDDDQEEGLFSKKKPVISKPTEIKKKNSLFDDDDDNEDTKDLFSFSNDKTKSNENKEEEVEEGNAEKDENKLDSEEIKNDVSVKQEEGLNNNNSSTSSHIKPVNLKFSPPPLFDNDEDENDKEIDWFK